MRSPSEPDVEEMRQDNTDEGRHDPDPGQNSCRHSGAQLQLTRLVPQLRETANGLQVTRPPKTAPYPSKVTVKGFGGPASTLPITPAGIVGNGGAILYSVNSLTIVPL